MNNRWNFLLGPVALAWFFAWTISLDLLRPEYDFRHKAISELGAIGAPYMIFMNLFGFIVTGLMLFGFAYGIHRSLNRQHWRSSFLLALSGLLFAATSIPIVMGTDGDPDYSATMTQIHLGFTQFAPIPWLIAMISYVGRVCNRDFRYLAILSAMAMSAILIVMFAAFSGIFNGQPGVFQRALFAIYLGWFASVGCWGFLERVEISNLPKKGLFLDER